MKHWLVFLLIGPVLAVVRSAPAQAPVVLESPGGLRLLAVNDVNQPTVRIVLPGRKPTDGSIEIQVPEHVTAVRHGDTVATHLFLPGGDNVERPEWRITGQSLEYDKELPNGVAMHVRVTLERDGVRFAYDLTNRSGVAFDMITAVTDPQLTGDFHDMRLQRTYVHHAEGLELLASEIPQRLTMEMNRWLPARVLASFTWPVPVQRVEQRGDRITYYNKSRKVDAPVILTRSTDNEWVVASVAKSPGNVWSNPQLTCQHVDQQASLGPGQRVTLEVKLLVMHASLEEVYEQAIRQRASLR